MADYRRIQDAKDALIAALYAKQSVSAEDAFPVLSDASGYLLVNMTVGTITISTTASTITNAVGNPVNVSLTSTLVTVSLNTTKVTVDNTVTVTQSSTLRTVALSPTVVTIQSAGGVNVNVATATLGTVTISGSVNVATATLGTVTVALSPTVVTVQNSAAGFNVNVATATLGTVTTSLSSTIVTVQNSAAGFNINVATATLGTVTISGSVNVATATLGTVTVSLSNTLVTVNLTPTFVTVGIVSGQTALLAGVGATGAAVLRTVEANDAGRTLTTASGTLSATNGTITLVPTNKAKIYAISLTTTSATELICILHSGGTGMVSSNELWRATLMAPAGANSGLNLAVTPPAYLFASRSGTAVSLSMNTATLVHYSVSYFDEA